MTEFLIAFFGGQVVIASIQVALHLGRFINACLSILPYFSERNKLGSSYERAIGAAKDKLVSLLVLSVWFTLATIGLFSILLYRLAEAFS